VRLTTKNAMEDQSQSFRTPDPQAAPDGAPAAGIAATRSHRKLGWLLVLLLVLGVLGWRIHVHKRATRAAEQSAAGQAPAQPVEVAGVIAEDVHIVLNSIGTATPLATITVRTQINGQLQKVGFTEGQPVHKGDLLAQIDPRPYQMLLEQAQGQLAHDEALLAQAQIDLARYQRLLEQDSIARQQAEDQLYLVEQYEGSIRSDRAQIHTQELNLTYCRITSPVDGQVGLRLVDPGNYIQTTDTNGIVVVTQLQPMSVIFPLAEDNLPAVLKRLHGGARLPVTAYDRANTSQLASGAVATVDNEIDTTTGTWKVRALFPNTDQALFPSQFVNARLLVDTLHDALTVPSAAVLRGAPGPYVYLLKANSTVTVRLVDVGPVDGNRIQVLSGLSARDRVVISGMDRLHEGVRVVPHADGSESGQNAGQIATARNPREPHSPQAQQ
jgi:membrane fusion protein, multidrug efflux system